MNDSDDDETRYPSRPNAGIYNSSLPSRRSIRNPTSYTHYGYNNQFQYNNDDDDESDEQEEEETQEFSSEDNENDTFSQGSRKKKKRKLENLVSNYHPGGSKEMWSEEESFVLLEVWGERYLELGRRSLRAEDWGEVAEKVTEMIGGVDKTEFECRNQLDVLKKKYKKEITKMEKTGVGFHGSKWPFFKKMDMLMNLRMKGHCGLGCGIDSGEYVFMDPRMYLDRSNVLDEMRDSPAGSDNDEEEEEQEESGGWEGDDESAKLLADSIQKFGQIYEKIENSKRKQMMELEKMRRDFQRELELQKKQIVDRAQAEIAKIRDNDDEEEEDGEETDNVSDEKLRS